MAVQLHLRRCSDADRESLNVALRQLSLTENQIRGLLRLTRDVQQLLMFLGESINCLRPLASFWNRNVSIPKSP